MMPSIFGGFMAVSKADIDALNSAIASGERQVSIGGQSVTYQTIASLIAARDDQVRQMNLESIAAGATARSKQTTLVFGGRGF